MFHNDVEQSLYYLNSRYYNPEIGRFINADGLIGETGELLAHNIYAYCMDNPVMVVDPTKASTKGSYYKELAYLIEKGIEYIVQ